MLVGLNFNYNGQTFASMKLNAKIAGSLHLMSDLAFRSVEIPLSRRLTGRVTCPPKTDPGRIDLMQKS